MRLIFLGTPEFAIPSLEALIAPAARRQGCEIRYVITQPDRPAGRGRRLTPPPVKVCASQAGIPVLQTARLRGDPEVYRTLEEVRPDLIVVVAFGQILPRDFFNFPRLGTLNVHASLLPRYRGASPVVRALLNGDAVTGTTIMKIDEGMDTGDILAQRELAVTENMTTAELEPLLAEQGADLLVETIPAYAAGTVLPRAQDHEHATYAPKVKKEDAWIDWRSEARTVHNQIRAYNRWPVAQTSLRAQLIKVWRSQNPAETLQSRPGRVLKIAREGVVVGCGQNTSLVLTELQVAGRNRNSAVEVANGMQLRVGDTFGEE